MRILHLFNEYLPKTEVWAYELLLSCPDLEHFIFADYYSNLDYFNQNLTLLNKKAGLLKKRRAELSRYDFPYNMFEPLVIASDLFSTKKRIKPLIDNNKIDVVHCHFGTTAIERWDEIKDINIPVVVSFYGWDYQKAIYYNPSYKVIYRSIFEKTSLLITEGNHGRKQLIGMGANPKKVKTLPLGISMTSKPVKTSFKKNGKLNVVQVSSFAEKKGQIYTVKAFESAMSKMPNQLKLTLVGDERDLYYAKEIKEYIRSRRLEHHIQIIDWIDFKHLDSFLLDYDVFIHPSIHAKDGDCEGGSPVILLHAQSVGLPVISSIHCDIPEQVRHSQTGYLVSEADISELSKQILKFAKMTEKEYFEMSTNCISFTKEHFDVVKIGKQLKSYYTALES